MKEDITEKRHHKRYLVEGMDISGTLMFAANVSVINISISGISLKADRRLELGREYTIKLKDRERIVTVKGQVMWSSLTGSKPGPHGEMVPVYSAGLKFTDVLNDRISEIVSFIEGHLKGEEHRLTGLRFNITKLSAAVLHFPSHYVVKKISAGGMLIESNEALDAESRFPMELAIPEEQPVAFTGRVASCSAVNNKGVEHYEIGIEFISMDDEDRKKVDALIKLLNAMDQRSPSL
ncbi:MAG: PilZ domain-containing protein [Thermodesulfovibrionales bacterium]